MCRSTRGTNPLVILSTLEGHDPVCPSAHQAAEVKMHSATAPYKGS